MPRYPYPTLSFPPIPPSLVRARPGTLTPEAIAAQDPTKDWRCKCNTVNKAGTHLCASRSCHCYFCLGCGQLGHQQRFCRRFPPAANPPGVSEPVQLCVQSPPPAGTGGAGLRIEAVSTRCGGAAATATTTAAIATAAAAAAATATASSNAANAGGVAVAGDLVRLVHPVQSVRHDWRCKCGTLNKACSFQCSKRGCRVFFCLGCGQLGHQQRFCRQPGPGGIEAFLNAAGSAPVVRVHLCSL